MINRSKVMKQMEDAASRSGKFRYLKKDTTTNLRVLEYTDADGDQMFAQIQVEHRKVGQQGGQSLGICRMETLGLPCAYCRINKIAIDSGKGRVFESRSRYVINAIAVDEDSQRVKFWVVPTSVFDQMSEYAMDDEWKDVFELKTGFAFGVKREGSGLDTTYTVKVKRQPYPVSKEIAKQATDPKPEIRDPGLEAQCAELGVSVGDIFETSELEEKSSNIKSRKKKETVEPEPKKDNYKPSRNTSMFEIGQAVTYEDEEAVCHVSKIDGDDITIEDEAGEEYDATPEQLHPVADEHPDLPDEGLKVGDLVLYKDEDTPCEITKIAKDGTYTIKDSEDNEFEDIAEDDLTKTEIPFDGSGGDAEVDHDENAPKCFGDPKLYDEDDDECIKCNYHDECSGNVGLDKAGVGKGSRKPAKTAASGKKLAKKEDVDDAADDLIANILAGR